MTTVLRRRQTDSTTAPTTGSGAAETMTTVVQRRPWRPAMAFVLVVLGLLAWLGTLPGAAKTAEPPTPLHGDLVFQRSQGALSELIAGVTTSPYTHCGIVVREGDALEVLEAIGPVKLTPWLEWCRRGRGGAVTVARLQRPIQGRMIAAARRYLGRPYDDRFVLGGEAIYCSELLYRAAQDGPHVEIAAPQRLRDLNWKPWEAHIRRLRNGALPLDERIITPVALLRSPMVRIVYQGL